MGSEPSTTSTHNLGAAILAFVGLLLLSLLSLTNLYDEKIVQVETVNLINSENDYGRVYAGTYVSLLVGGSSFYPWWENHDLFITIESSEYSPVYAWITTTEEAVYALTIPQHAPRSCWWFSGVARTKHEITLDRTTFIDWYGEDQYVELICVVVGKASGYIETNYKVTIDDYEYSLVPTKERTLNIPILILWGFGTVILAMTSAHYFIKAKTTPARDTG